MVVNETFKSIALIAKNPLLLVPSIILALIGIALNAISETTINSLLEKIINIESIGSKSFIELPGQLFTFVNQEIILLIVISFATLLFGLIFYYWIALNAIKQNQKKTNIFNNLSEALKASPQLFALSIFFVVLAIALMELFLLALTVIEFNWIIGIIITLIILLAIIWLVLNLIMVVPAMTYLKEKANGAVHKSMTFFSKKPGQIIALLVITLLFSLIVSWIIGVITSFIAIELVSTIIWFLAMALTQTFNLSLFAIYYSENK